MTPSLPLSRLLVAAAIAGAAAAGCVPPQATGAARPSPKASQVARPKVTGSGTTPAAGPAELRPIAHGIAHTLTGKVKLITDGGAGLVSDHGGALVSAESGRILSNNGGSMIGKTKFYGLAAHGAVPEDLLADAVVEVLDAQGRLLAAPDGKPYQAVSDQTGRYRLEATLPAENVVLRVRLDPALGGEGGQLAALVAGAAAAGPLPIDLDTASSLGASYVLREYVKGDQAVLDRLPAEAYAALRRDAELARALLPGRPASYAPDALAKTAGELRAQAPALDGTLRRIEAILLAGQRDLGTGLAATQVALALPVAVAVDPGGAIFVAESVTGRIRRIAPDGTLSLFAGDAADGRVADGVAAREATFETLDDLVGDGAGGLYVVERGAHRVVQIKADGTLRVVAGTGTPGQGAPGGPAREAPLSAPTAAAVGPDGTLYVVEAKSGGRKPRVLAIGQDGLLRELAPPAGQDDWECSGVAATADGAVWVATGAADGVWRRDPAGAWVRVASPLELGYYGRLLAAADNGVYVSENGGDRVLHLTPAGAITVLGGPGKPGEPRNSASDLTAAEETRRLLRPTGMARRADGKLLVVDAGHMLVRLVDPAVPGGEMPIVAGTTGIVQVGSAQALAVNGPAGLATAPDGRLVFAELGGHAVKALGDGRIDLIAGGREGPASEGGAARAAALVAPAGVAYDRQGNLWIIESVRPRLLRVSPEGRIEWMAGTGLATEVVASVPALEAARTPGRALQMGRPASLAIGPDDRPYWADQGFNVVMRLAPDGVAEVVAGKLPARFDQGDDAGDGGPAAAAAFRYPTGIAFDSRGDLYVSDTLNFRVRKIAMGEPDRPITTVAGLAQGETLGALLADGGFRPTEGGAAAEQPLVVPGPIFIDGRDRLYVGEGGTSRLRSLAGNGSLALPVDPPRVPARVRRVDLRDARRPITTIAGPGGKVLTAATGDDSPGIPLGLLVDPQGRLTIADGLYNQLKLVPDAALE